MSKYETRQLEAGGLVGAKSKVDVKATEEVVARRYRGEALGDRIVVRLGADRLGPAVDLAMEYLGLEAIGASKPLARQNRQALGFANWALTNHPKHAKYALGLVKRIKAAARRAKSKPGHAWDDFSEMAAELNKSVRHFLPAFWEEAARIYKDYGNQTYAGRSLNKALEAERVHAIDVDREHRRDAVLEFTLSGCLSGKALSEYAKDLQDQFDPSDAYATLRDLVIRRTLGGMAPTATMGTDLIRLAKATESDSDSEVESVLEEIIGSPAMSRAPIQFWKSVKAYVKRIVKRSPQFAVWLLVHTNPQSRYSGDSVAWQWIDLLDGWNVLPYLWAEKLPAEPEIPGGKAGWIGRLARLETSPDKRIFELLEAMTEALKKEGKPVRLFEKARWGHATIDVDVLEACLDLGIELAEFPDEFQVDFAGWLRAEIDHPRRNSSLEHSCKDERVALVIRENMPDLIPFHGETTSQHHYGRQLASRRAFEEAAENHPAIHDAWWAYLDEQLQRLETGGVPDAEIALGNLRKCVGRKTASQFPELPKRIEAVDLANNLQRTLTAGVLDEYGWTPLDQAAQDVKMPVATRYGASRQHWMFPIVCYCNADSLVIVRPDRVEKRELALKAKQEVMALLPVADDVMVAYRDTSDYKTFLRWLSEPKKNVEPKSSLYYFRPPAILTVEGGVFFGQRLMKPGDTAVPEPGQFFCDGERFWQQKSQQRAYGMDDDDSDPGLAEIDLLTGKTQRDSVPSWFEENLPAGSRINWHLSLLLPVPDCPGDSPLGSRKGLIGWKLIQRRDRTWEGHGIDGRRISLSDYDQPYFQNLLPLAMMDQPAGKSRWIFTNTGYVIDEATRLCIADFSENQTSYCAGQPTQIPVQFLHLMRVRHQPSSKRLRKLRQKDAKTLLDAGTTQHEAQHKRAAEDDPRRRAATTAVEELLPEAPEKLTAGVARIARLCAEEQISLDKLRAKLTEEPGADELAVEGAEAARITAGLSQLAIPKLGTGYHSIGSGGETDAARHLREAVEFLNGKRDADITACDVAWLGLFHDLPSTAWRTFWQLATAEDQHPSIALRVRQPWLDTLEFVANSGMLDLPGGIRIHVGEDRSKKSADSWAVFRESGVGCWLQGKNRYMVQIFWGHPHKVAHILEYAPKGKFQTPKGYTIKETQAAAPGWTGKQLRTFISAARKVEELPLASAEQIEQAASELGVTPVEVAIVWMGNLRTVHYGNDKLTKEIRSHYKWKVKPVQEAIAGLEATPVAGSVIAAPICKDPADALGNKRDAAFDRMVETWKKTQSDVLRIPPELITLFEKSSHRYYDAPSEALIRLYRERSKSEFLKKRKCKYQLDKLGRGHSSISRCHTPESDEHLEEMLGQVVFSIRLFNYAAPAGDPVRRVLPDLIEALRRWLDYDTTVLPFGMPFATRDYQDFVASEIIAKYEQAMKKFKKGKDGLYQCDDGLVIAALLPPHVDTVFRPARLKDKRSLDHLITVAALSSNWESTGETAIDHAHLVLDMRSKSMSRIAESNRENPVEDGGWEQDPRISSTKTVAAVKRKLKLKEDSATVYLQLLALPDPTTVNIRKWNDWSAKQVKAAVAPLVESGHLVEAKRSRAGRDVFLPGGWEALKTPNLPIETWKLPLYELSADRLDVIRYRRIVPLAPVADLFAAAWKRIQAGDVPKYEEA